VQIFTTGQIQIWIVSQGDGYECLDFIGAFESEDQANAAAVVLRADMLASYGELHNDKGHPCPGYVEVKPVILGQYERRKLPSEPVAD
jgi:hypothetical protein